MDNLSILQMIQISDSLFPIGAFTLSNGLETFVTHGKLCSDEDLEKYVKSYLALLPYGDLGTMLFAYEHSTEMGCLCELDEYTMAWKTPKEVRQGSKKLCRRFLKIWEKIHPYPILMAYQKKVEEGECEGNHSIAVGLYAKAIGLEKEEAGMIYAYSLLSAIVTNAVKTVPLSQMSGQRILYDNLPFLVEQVQLAGKLDREELGVGGTEFDIEAMNHETLYSRLYMS